MPFIFDRNATKALISLYEKHNNLYMVSTPLYKNKNAKQESFKSMADELNRLLNITDITSADVNKKVNNLRTQYFNEKNKVKKSEVSGAGSAEVYVPSWWCFKDLGFLTNSAPIRNSESNLNVIPEEMEAEENLELLYDGAVEDINLYSQNIPEETRSEVSLPLTKTPSSSSKRKRRNALQDTNELLVNAVAALNNEKNVEPDHFEAFGQMVSSELRRVKSPENVDNLKIKILSLIYEEIRKNN